VNILRNEMSLIGPRPCLPAQEKLVAERRGLNVFSVLPGISGLAQVQGIDMITPEVLARCDARYIATRGLVQEFKLIIKTVFGSRNQRAG
jgi:O-antigen biosynthesis protein WbqP